MFICEVDEVKVKSTNYNDSLDFVAIFHTLYIHFYKYIYKSSLTIYLGKWKLLLF